MLLSHIKLFQKAKKGLELVLLPHFLHNYLRKIFLLIYSTTWLNVMVWLSLLCEILGNVCIVIVCWPGCDVLNFEINLICLIKPFFLHDQKLKTKMSVSWEWKDLLRSNKKHFSSFLNGFHWRKKREPDSHNTRGAFITQSIFDVRYLSTTRM